MTPPRTAHPPATAGRISADADARSAFARDESGAAGETPRAVAEPATEAEVRELVRWANATGTPLVPVSSGPPRFRGDTVPGAPEAVIVDLRRMDAVRRIDRRDRMAVIEPGVTLSALQPILAEQGLRLSAPLRPRAGKSVIASLLEREPTPAPRYHYAFPEPLRTCGVVWGDGQVTYTGEAGYGPRSLDAQWRGGGRQVDPKGPAQTDFVRLLSGAQGTLGIVTWASVKCQLLPAVRGVLFVGSERLRDLLGPCGRLLRLRLGDELFVANAAFLSAVTGVPRAGLPPWALVIGLAGRAHFPGERLAVQTADVCDVVRDLGAAAGLEPAAELPDLTAERMLQVFTEVSDEPYWRIADGGGTRDVFFQTTLDRIPGMVEAAAELASAHGCDLARMGVYVQPQQQGAVHHCEFTVPFDPADERAAAAARAFSAAAPARLADLGAYFSRPYGPWADVAYSRDPAAAHLLRIAKRVFDPNGVLNPGRLCFRHMPAPAGDTPAPARDAPAPECASGGGAPEEVA